MRPQEGRQRFGSHKLDAVPQYTFQEIAESDQVVERLLAGRELDKQVDVTVRTRYVAVHRSEQRQAPNAQPENLGLGRRQAGLNFRAGRGLSDDSSM